MLCMANSARSPTSSKRKKRNRAGSLRISTLLTRESSSSCTSPRPALRAAALLLLLALGAHAQQLESRRTRDLDLVYYDKAHEYLSYHLARSFENSLNFDKKLFGYTPTEPVVILMEDFGDYGHGGTSTVPWNYISIGIEPFDYVYDVMPSNERMNWLMHHELVHVVATDKGADADLRFRRLFRGK